MALSLTLQGAYCVYHLTLVTKLYQNQHKSIIRHYGTYLVKIKYMHHKKTQKNKSKEAKKIKS